MISALDVVAFGNDSSPLTVAGNDTAGGAAPSPNDTAANGVIQFLDDDLSFPGYIRTTCMVVCVIILGVGVVGNMMVPIVILKSKDMRNSTNIFLMNLSIADLMVLLICTPTVFVEVNSRPETWVLGEELCKAVPFVELTVAHASVLTILAISFERYYAICEPLRAGYVCTKTRAMIICLLAWGLAALFTRSPIMWSIVNFAKDNSVSAVPSHWWKNGYCAWPKSSVKHPLLLLQRRAIPNKFDFDFFKARIMHTKNPIKSYIDAKERARRAQFTSELSSADESQTNRRSNKYNNRSISPPVFSDTDDENKKKSLEKNHYNSQPESIKSKKNKSFKFNSQVLSDTANDNTNKSLEENLSNIQPESIESKKNKPIKFNSQVLSGNEDHENKNNCSQSKSQPQMTSGHQVLSDNSDEITDNVDDSDIDKTYEPPNHDRNEMNNHFEIIQSPVGSWKVHSVSDEETDNQNLNDNQYIKRTFTHKTPEMNKVKKRLFMSASCIETKKLKSQPIVSSFDNLFQSSTKSDVLEMEYSNLNNDTDFVSFVKSSLTNLKYDLKLLSYSIDSLKTIIQSIEVNTSHISSINSEHNNVMDIQELIWPISNLTQLDVNEQLLTDTNIKKNEVKLLARLVGKSISESVRRMMSKMFEDSFLQQYSFLGFKGKSKFYGLNSCQLLFDALRSDKKFIATPDHEISTVTAKWLAQATNRVTKKKKDLPTKN